MIKQRRTFTSAFQREAARLVLDQATTSRRRGGLDWLSQPCPGGSPSLCRNVAVLQRPVKR